MTGWRELEAALDARRPGGKAIRLWWRDDDAGRDDPASSACSSWPSGAPCRWRSRSCRSGSMRAARPGSRRARRRACCSTASPTPTMRRPAKNPVSSAARDRVIEAELAQGRAT